MTLTRRPTRSLGAVALRSRQDAASPPEASTTT
jgi:hypothetical protein